MAGAPVCRAKRTQGMPIFASPLRIFFFTQALTSPMGQRPRLTKLQTNGLIVLSNRACELRG
jgi:hypothetical protein